MDTAPLGHTSTQGCARPVSYTHLDVYKRQGYNTDEIVSSDVIGIRYGSLFDATQTMVTKLDDDTYQVQVVS